VRYEKFEEEVLFHKNLMEDGKWLISIEDAFINDIPIFKEFAADNSCNAVIATALNTIKMPKSDFNALEVSLNQ